MVLKTHTAEELQNADLDSLLNTLVSCTEHYTSLIRTMGFSNESETFKHAIKEIQAAIDERRKHL